MQDSRLDKGDPRTPSPLAGEGRGEGETGWPTSEPSPFIFLHISLKKLVRIFESRGL